MESLDLRGIECEEALMSIRYLIRKNKMTSGQQFEITSTSEPFQILFKRWVTEFNHTTSITQDLDCWKAIVTV